MSHLSYNLPCLRGSEGGKPSMVHCESSAARNGLRCRRPRFLRLVNSAPRFASAASNVTLRIYVVVRLADWTLAFRTIACHLRRRVRPQRAPVPSTSEICGGARSEILQPFHKDFFHRLDRYRNPMVGRWHRQRCCDF